MATVTNAQSAFVKRSGQQFILSGKPYYYIGANYWYGGFLALGKNKKNGIERLHKELDFLKSKGVTNLRLLAGVEGTGMINGVERVRPALQISQGIFDTTHLEGLDLILSEMGKRNMKAVIFLSNNWEWSGGFLQYLNWNGLIDDSIVKRKLTWDEQRDYTSKFYSCSKCVKNYLKQVKIIISRTNKITNKKYSADPTIMSWELVNEPRPMRPTANEAYKKWITNTAAFIRALDKNHLVTLGHEGDMATDGDIKLYEQIHADKNVDYLTIHIWPKNWSWFKEQSFEEDLPAVKSKTIAYIDKHVTIAKKLHKPLVIEEFGLPRDGQSFDINSTTIVRDEYYKLIFSEWEKNKKNNDVIAGISFWAFGGTARPVKGQIFWKGGDEYMGDPPMEEQGLNSVFDSDKSTWKLIRSFTKSINIAETNSTKFSSINLVDKNATPETKALFYNLKELSKNHTLFGHQHATQYGHGWSGDADRSDVKSVTGSHPAVIGIDLSGFSGGSEKSIQHTKDDDRKTVVDTYDRGGVTTVAWHFNNPISPGGFYWKDSVSLPAIKYIIPHGSAHEKYKEILRSIGEWANNTRGKDGKLVPMILRPFHEFDGDWFWWGKSHCTREEFILLWRFTVSYLRDSVGVHNFIYAFSPDNRFNSEQEYLDRYPGDDWVDMLGVDNYGDMGRDGYHLDSAIKKLKVVSNYAIKKGKIAAFTETGLESIPNPDWWTEDLLKVMKSPGLQLAYVLVWRNDVTSIKHFYAPFPGQISVPDFIKFYNDPYTLFEKDLPNMYKQ